MSRLARQQTSSRIRPGDSRYAGLEVTLPEYHETLRPTYVVREFSRRTRASPWLMLIQVLPVGTDLDKVAATDDRHWQASPHAQFERLLRETQVPIGLLVNGDCSSAWSMPRAAKPAATDVQRCRDGPGGRPADLRRPAHAALRGAALQPGRKQRLPAILADSRKYQNVVSTKLAEQVLAALYELVRGFQAADDQAKGELLREVLAADPNHVYTAC